MKWSACRSLCLCIFFVVVYLHEWSVNTLVHIWMKEQIYIWSQTCFCSIARLVHLCGSSYKVNTGKKKLSRHHLVTQRVKVRRTFILSHLLFSCLLFPCSLLLVLLTVVDCCCVFFLLSFFSPFPFLLCVSETHPQLTGGEWVRKTVRETVREGEQRVVGNKLQLSGLSKRVKLFYALLLHNSVSYCPSGLFVEEN